MELISDVCLLPEKTYISMCTGLSAREKIDRSQIRVTHTQKGLYVYMVVRT